MYANIDSLQVALQIASGKQYINLAISCSDEYYRAGAFDSSFAYAKKALWNAIENKYLGGIQDAYYRLAIAEPYRGNNLLSILYLKELIRINGKIGNKKKQANYSGILASIYINTLNYEESKKVRLFQIKLASAPML